MKDTYPLMVADVTYWLVHRLGRLLNGEQLGRFRCFGMSPGEMAARTMAVAVVVIGKPRKIADDIVFPKTVVQA